MHFEAILAYQAYYRDKFTIMILIKLTIVIVIVPLSPSTNMHAACMSNESSMHTYKSHTCGMCVCSMFKILVCHMQVSTIYANYLCVIYYMQTACMHVTNMPRVLCRLHMVHTCANCMCALHAATMPHACYLNICTINS